MQPVFITEELRHTFRDIVQANAAASEKDRQAVLSAATCAVDELRNWAELFNIESYPACTGGTHKR